MAKEGQRPDDIESKLATNRTYSRYHTNTTAYYCELWYDVSSMMNHTTILLLSAVAARNRLVATWSSADISAS